MDYCYTGYEVDRGPLANEKLPWNLEGLITLSLSMFMYIPVFVASADNMNVLAAAGMMVDIARSVDGWWLC